MSRAARTPESSPSTTPQERFAAIQAAVELVCDPRFALSKVGARADEKELKALFVTSGDPDAERGAVVFSAVDRDRTHLLPILVGAGCDIDVGGGEPLARAVQKNNPQAVRDVLKAGANPFLNDAKLACGLWDHRVTGGESENRANEIEAMLNASRSQRLLFARPDAAKGKKEWPPELPSADSVYGLGKDVEVRPFRAIMGGVGDRLDAAAAIRKRVDVWVPAEDVKNLTFEVSDTPGFDVWQTQIYHATRAPDEEICNFVDVAHWEVQSWDKNFPEIAVTANGRFVGILQSGAFMDDADDLVVHRDSAPDLPPDHPHLLPVMVMTLSGQGGDNGAGADASYNVRFYVPQTDIGHEAHKAALEALCDKLVATARIEQAGDALSDLLRLSAGFSPEWLAQAVKRGQELYTKTQFGVTAAHDALSPLGAAIRMNNAATQKQNTTSSKQRRSMRPS